MEQRFYFDNYTAVGDIIVLATCMVIAVLLATSYVTRTKRFNIYINMLVYICLAALSNVILHHTYAHLTGGDYTIIYVLRVMYHAFLFSLLLLYIVYIVEVIQIDKKARSPIMRASTIIYFVVIITDIYTTATRTGFLLKNDGTSVSAFNVFFFGYFAFIIILGYVMIKYRNRVYKKAMMGLAGTILVSLLILNIQGRHGQSSFTTVTFLFPIISVMYLLHSNPYDVKTGAINSFSFLDMVAYNYSKKRNFYLISLFLPDFHSEGKPLPKELEAIAREFPSSFFKKTVLYRVGGGDVLLMIPEKFNPNCEQKFEPFIETFMAEYEKYHFDYKLIMGKSIDEISRRNEYISMIRNMRRNMPLNSVHIVTEDDVAAFNKSEDILEELEDICKKQDLDDERVLVYCQPVLNIRTGRYDTAEALMRLNLPGLGMVFPDRFIPLAEEHGYIHTLTKIILHKTCKALKAFIDEGFYVKRISVNVSMHELYDERFTKDFEDIINSCSIQRGKIAIEITESQSDSDFLVVKNMIEGLKEAGIKFYLDDFGTGYSNIERIMKLPFDIIKFDRSLVIASQTDKRSEEIVERLAGMFSDLHYSVLYEGVETEEDEARCVSMHASYLQGYKYSRPLPIEEVKAYFSKEENHPDK